MLTIKKCEEHVIHNLDGPMGAPMSMRELVKVNGEWLHTIHAWSFAKARHVVLTPRPRIDLVDATWTEATKQIELTGAFSQYALVDEDKIEITGGTGANLGTYEVTLKQNSNQILLATSIGANADGETDIQATMPNNTVELPSNIRDIIAIDTNDANDEGFSWVGESAFMHGQIGRYSFANTYIRGMVSAVQAHTDPSEIRYVLEFDPGSADPPQIYLRYRTGFVLPATDILPLPLPIDGELDMLFLQGLFAHARGLDKEQDGAMVDRLAQIEQSSLMARCKARDGSKQRTMGKVRGSAIRQRRGYRGENRSYDFRR